MSFQEAILDVQIKSIRVKTFMSIESLYWSGELESVNKYNPVYAAALYGNHGLGVQIWENACHGRSWGYSGFIAHCTYRTWCSKSTIGQTDGTKDRAGHQVM